MPILYHSCHLPVPSWLLVDLLTGKPADSVVELYWMPLLTRASRRLTGGRVGPRRRRGRRRARRVGVQVGRRRPDRGSGKP